MNRYASMYPGDWEQRIAAVFHGGDDLRTQQKTEPPTTDADTTES